MGKFFQGLRGTEKITGEITYRNLPLSYGFLSASSNLERLAIHLSNVYNKSQQNTLEVMYEHCNICKSP